MTLTLSPDYRQARADMLASVGIVEPVHVLVCWRMTLDGRDYRGQYVATHTRGIADARARHARNTRPESHVTCTHDVTARYPDTRRAFSACAEHAAH